MDQINVDEVRVQPVAYDEWERLMDAREAALLAAVGHVDQGAALRADLEVARAERAYQLGLVRAGVPDWETLRGQITAGQFRELVRRVREVTWPEVAQENLSAAGGGPATASA